MKARLSALKAALGITDTEGDPLLTVALRTVEAQILSYTHQETLPKGLEDALVLMTAAWWKTAGLGSEQAASGPVASVKRGDVSTSFAAAAGADASGGTFGLGGGDGFFGWRTVLNAYRKVRW